VKDDDIKLGLIEFDTGFVNVEAHYNAICFRPFVNEVMDATVGNVTELGFFANVGPLEVFVSRLGMPDDIANGYDPVGDMWVSGEGSDNEIKAGCGVRLRIIGVTMGTELVSPG
ncbi:unnamed protein product, partial [Discosporangium mesarthrocarpum]